CCLLECPYIDFHTWTELHIRSGEGMLRQKPAIEQASDRRRPGVMERVPHPLNTEWRTEMIQNWHTRRPSSHIAYFECGGGLAICQPCKATTAQQPDM